MNRRSFNRCLIACTSLPAMAWNQPAGWTKVQAKKKPSDPEWTVYPTRPLETLSGLPRRPPVNKYGGRSDRKGKATGFFHAQKLGRRWWLVDPSGNLFLDAGMCSVGPGSSERAKAALQEKFGTRERWAEATTSMLRDNGFTSAAAWSSIPLLRNVEKPLPYTNTLNFLSTFGKSKNLTHRQPGHTGFVNDCPPVFHPEFAKFCDTYASVVAERKDDPLLIGHFSDNELPAPRNLLDRSLKLDVNNADLVPGYEAAARWLADRKVQPGSISDADRDAFLEYTYERYLSLTCGALRKHDPNHMCLGPRLWGPSMTSPGILRASGRHLDVIAINIYFQWEPERQLLDMWVRESNKPLMVTEFYAKGVDSGLANTTGAGWLVPTQNDRGLFYQHFTLALLESRQFVGWHWLTYQDNDPQNKGAELSNIDSNKGIVSITFEPYTALLNRMKALHQNMYAIADSFDRA